MAITLLNGVLGGLAALHTAKIKANQTCKKCHLAPVFYANKITKFGNFL